MSRWNRILASVVITASLMGHSLAWAQHNVNVTMVTQLIIGGTGLVVSGSYIYESHYHGFYLEGGLRIYDISNPVAPVQTADLIVEAWAYDVSVCGNYAYLSCSWLGVYIIDISNPYNPSLVSILATQGAHETMVYNGYLYLADNFDGLLIIDVSNPQAPAIVGRYDTPGAAGGVVVFDDYAYVADNSGGLRVINVSNPTVPFEVGFYTSPDFVNDVALVWPYAYLACESDGFRVVDVSNPTTPVEVGSFAVWGLNYHVAVVGPFAYLANGGYGINVLDITNPANPTLVGTYYSNNASPCNILPVGEWLYSDTPFQVNQFTPLWTTIDIEPFNPPIEIPAGGGSFEFGLRESNHGADTSRVQGWTMQQTPSGAWQGPLLGPQLLILPADQFISRRFTQNVPASAEPGVYMYHAYTGFYPNIKVDSASFTYVKLTSGDGSSPEGWTCSGELFTDEEATDTRSDITLPDDYGMLCVYPNPFNPSTVASFELRVTSYVSLKIYNTAGRLVATLVDGWREAGEHEVRFDGSGLPSGIYLATFVLSGSGATSTTEVQKLVLMK